MFCVFAQSCGWSALVAHVECFAIGGDRLFDAGGRGLAPAAHEQRVSHVVHGPGPLQRRRLAGHECKRLIETCNRVRQGVDVALLVALRQPRVGLAPLVFPGLVAIPLRHLPEGFAVVRGGGDIVCLQFVGGRRAGQNLAALETAGPQLRFSRIELR